MNSSAFIKKIAQKALYVSLTTADIPVICIINGYNIRIDDYNKGVIQFLRGCPNDGVRAVKIYVYPDIKTPKIRTVPEVTPTNKSYYADYIIEYILQIYISKIHLKLLNDEEAASFLTHKLKGEVFYET